MDQNIYEENGYADRGAYLISLSEEYEIPLETVLLLADLYGEDEDFDGLLTSLDDYADDIADSFG